MTDFDPDVTAEVIEVRSEGFVENVRRVHMRETHLSLRGTLQTDRTFWPVFPITARQLEWAA